jgi:WD40 repeat protein
LNHGSKVKAVAISPDGRRIVSGGNDDEIIKFWNAENGSLERSLSARGEEQSQFGVEALSFNDDGSLVAAVAGAVSVWETASGRRVWISNDDGSPNDVKFSPDGRQLATATLNGISIWDVDTGRRVHKTVEPPAPATKIAFSPDGSRLISHGEKGVRVWDLTVGRLLEEDKEDSYSDRSASSKDGKFAATVFSGIAIWDAATGQKLRTLPAEYLRQMAFSPDGQVLITQREKTLTVRRANDSSEVRSINVQQSGVRGIEFSPDGRTIAVATLESVTLYEVGSGRLVRTFQTRRSGKALYMNFAVAFSPDGRSIVTGGEIICSPLAGCTGSPLIRWGIIRTWEVASGRLIRSMDDYKESVRTIGISNDGQFIVGVGRDNTIKVWNSTTGRFIRSLHGNATTATSVLFSPDGRRIAAGSESEIKIWNAASGEILASLVSSNSGEWVAITPEGFFEASANGADLLYLVNGLETTSIQQLYQSLYRPDALEGYRGHGLFTYNVLEALERADGDGNGTIEVAELAAYVHAQVTALSEKVFRQRQVPQVRVTANYALAKPARVLPATASEIVIPARPTHQIASPSQLLVMPALGARQVRKLDANTAVTLVNSGGGWTLIAKEGRPLGYVATKNLVPLQ